MCIFIFNDKGDDKEEEDKEEDEKEDRNEDNDSEEGKDGEDEDKDKDRDMDKGKDKSLSQNKSRYCNELLSHEQKQPKSNTMSHRSQWRTVQSKSSNGLSSTRSQTMNDITYHSEEITSRWCNEPIR